MKHISIILFLFAQMAHSEEIQWDEESLVTADINCDGIVDHSKIGYDKLSVILMLELGDRKGTELLKFRLSSGISQSSLCGSKVTLSKEEPPKDDDDAFKFGLGAVPDGHKSLEGCFDLNLSGGECDSIHVYWNHNRNKLSWWRL